MKKLGKRTLLFICLLLCTILFSSCAKKYTVTFIVGEATYLTEEVKKKGTVNAPEDPVLENHEFAGWFSGYEEFNFSIPIKQDYTLVAKFISNCDKLGHTYQSATCSLPSTCSVCGQTTGSALGHSYKSDCDTVCDVCGESRTTTVGHSWINATHTTPKTCENCQETVGDVIPYPESISLNVLEKTIYIGDTIQFIATISPSNAPQEVNYSMREINDPSNTNNYATITKDGLFTGLAAGTIYVTVSSADKASVTCVAIINILHPLLEEEKYDAYNIMTGFGTDASTQIEINYHTHSTKTFVEYTLASDTDFSNYSTKYGSGYYFTHGKDSVESEFEPRNVYRVSITDLKPNTEYIYRINKGNNTYSDTYHFKTASNEGGCTSFFIMSDTHYATKLSDETVVSHGSEISEQIIQQALLMNPDIGFVATAGDTVDTGGNADMWNIFFNESQSLKVLPRIGVAGNHEYYIKGTTQSDGKYQKAHYATPYNGPSQQLGLSCYYVYNDILFVIVDNEKSIGRTEMLSWLEEVLATNESRYSFVMMHTPVYYEKDETSNQDRDEALLQIFEKYSVDLVLAGHYHGDRLRTNYYQGEDSTDPGLGVNYMTLSFSGVKSASEANPATGYIFTTENGVITITRIKADGTVVSVRTITSKRNQEVVTETKQNLIDSITTSYDSENSTYTFNFSNKFYGNVEKVNIKETLRGTINKEMYFPTPSYNKIVLPKGNASINKFYDHHFVLTITFKDGTTEVLEYDLNLSNLNPTVQDVTSSSAKVVFDSADSSLDWTIKEYEIYVNGQRYDKVEYMQYDGGLTSYTFNNLSSQTEYEVKFVALDYQGRQLFSFAKNFNTK